LAESASSSLQNDIDFFLMAHRDTLGLVVQKIETADETNSAKFVLSSEVTGLPMNYSVTVDKEQPYKIASYSLKFSQTIEGNEEKISLEQAEQELWKLWLKEWRLY
jgi:hypothetical protein